jgi:hypothetical protein
MAFGRPGCGPCGQPQQRRRLLGLTACIGVLFLLAPWLRMFAAAGYGVAWWSLAAEVHWARPGSAPAPAQAAAAAAVPKLMHQTWQTKQVPAKWAAARKSCIDLHPDFEHRLWTDEEGLAFIKKHYPWFLPTYVAYPYSIQRVDVLRYFLLHHFGGIYIDLDMGCNKRLDFMLQHNFTAPLTHPVGISNDVMAAVPGDAYLAHIVRRLASWNHWLFIKYIQVMFSTGPMFLTLQYSMFPNRADVGIIPADVYGAGCLGWLGRALHSSCVLLVVAAHDLSMRQLAHSAPLLFCPCSG